MGKRIGRKRLFALNKAGETQTQTAGSGISDSIGSQTRLRSGEEIISEITIDLANGSAAASSFATAGVAGQATHKIIGVSSSSGTHSNAQILQVNKSSTDADGNGIITAGELICVEAAAGGEDNIGLWYANNASGSGNDMLGAGNELAQATSQVLGEETAFSFTAADLDDKYLYLVSSGSTAGVYTAGKFIIRLYGYNAFDDVS